MDQRPETNTNSMQIKLAASLVTLLCGLAGSCISAEVYSYDLLNRLTSAANSGGTQTTYSYDPAGNLAGIANLTTNVGLVTITRQPTAQTARAGDFASMDVGANGFGTLSYQWRFNGADLEGQTDSFLWIDSVNMSQAGQYSVVVSNSFGGITSKAATLTVTPTPPTITNQPQNLTVTAGSTASFLVKVSSTDLPTLSFQWMKNGVNISGATNPLYRITATTTNDAGSYSVAVQDSSGKATSSRAVLSVVGSTPTPPTLADCGIVSGTHFQFDIEGTPGERIVIEVSTNLLNWLPVATNSINSSGSANFIDSSELLHQRYYRVR